nr:hypothetical protein [Natronomonas gomsonensis]
MLAGALAGCTGDNGDERDNGDNGDERNDSGVTDEATDTNTATDESGLDLREANVIGVEAERVDGGYRFSVTLYHDDDGEEGYANWWQLETLDGDRLGRRDLAHSHGTREFTRFSTVEIPENVDCVVVRGHDQTHGYGGRAVLFALDSGATRGVQQGSEPTTFDESDCP